MGWASNLFRSSDHIDCIIDEAKALKTKRSSEITEGALVSLRMRIYNFVKDSVPEWDRRMQAGLPPPRYKYSPQEMTRITDILEELIVKQKFKDIFNMNNDPQKLVRELLEKRFRELLNKL
jgi:hypothetical protein